MKRSFVSMQNGKIKQVRGRFGGECERYRDEFWGDKAEHERSVSKKLALIQAKAESLEFMENPRPADSLTKITGMEEVLYGTDHSVETVGRILEITFKHKGGSRTFITRQQRTKQVHFQTGGRHNQRLHVTLNTDGFGRLTSACAA